MVSEENIKIIKDFVNNKYERDKLEICKRWI